MLQVKNIVKIYRVADLEQKALKDVSISFRENEFVSILGPSGSGKTTLLNIIGGLDRYTEGDLLINGVSTKKYKDADWDTYRNHSIGFVFQSYNLIPHQTVLQNVEMALTLAGVSRKERRQRAVAVLKKVGLEQHIHKKPNQMSGGQMQRVAIARALVNNPDILLADEPTGALDSETSVQIMDLLKDIAKDKLVIMVTHNPELAEMYSTRIVRLLDGEIVSDTDPFNPEQEREQRPEPEQGTRAEKSAPAGKKAGKKKKVSMSFLTALSLSFDNLRTKKGRTLLTAFAGSIGIIGIALILSLSNGMNAYIDNIQKDTMSSYPITISDETLDLSGIMGERQQRMDERKAEEKGEKKATAGDAIYADYTVLKMTETSLVENNLAAFKKYLDDPDSKIHQYVGENGITYTYDVNFSVYAYDPDDKLRDTSEDPDDKSDGFGGGSNNGQSEMMASFGGSVGAEGASDFSQLLAGADGTGISKVLKDQYDLVYGSWPEKYDEVVLVTNENHTISAAALYRLGLISKKQYDDAADDIREGKTPDEIRFSYRKACGHTFYLVPACDQYEKKENGTYEKINVNDINAEEQIQNAVKLKITGVICPESDDNISITTAAAYPQALTDYLIQYTDKSDVVKAQEADPDRNVLTGMKFESKDEDGKVEDAKEYLKNLGISEKASFYQLMMYYGNAAATKTDAGISSAPAVPAGIASASDGVPADGSASVGGEAAAVNAGIQNSETAMASALDQWLEGNPDRDLLLRVYDQYVAGATYEDNLKAFGKIRRDTPSSISIYTDSFEDKDNISDCISEYNDTASEENQITYTDYVALLTSSVTTIINGISYVLIAFVAISLVVSCIMIGIITHISVLERTKEIGILRSLGASKRNISQVFNAETFIIGCCAGILGIGISLLLLIPLNAVIRNISGLEDLKAVLPAQASAVLILISIVITMMGGLIPARRAAKQDPVTALRSE